MRRLDIHGVGERLLVAAVTVVVVAGCTTTVPSPPTTATAPPTTSTPPPATSAAPPTTAGAATQSASAVSLAAFAGTWSGHTRSLTVSASGIGHETVSDGCCTPEVDLTFRLSNPRGTSAANATATATVTAVALYDAGLGPAPKVGQTGTVSLSDGVLTDSLGGATFCDQAAAARSACGA